MTVLIAYLLNLFIPRSGEFARAVSIKEYEGIPFEKAFGTIVAERVTDVIMLLAIIGLAFYIQTDLVSSYIFKDDGQSSLYSKIIIFIILPLCGFFIYRYLKKFSGKTTFFKNKYPSCSREFLREVSSDSSKWVSFKSPKRS